MAGQARGNPIAPTGKILRLDRALDNLLAKDANIERVATGFFTGCIVRNRQRLPEIRTCFATAGIGAVAKSAVRTINFLSARQQPGQQVGHPCPGRCPGAASPAAVNKARVDKRMFWI
jgi:hypothetical protein